MTPAHFIQQLAMRILLDLTQPDSRYGYLLKTLEALQRRETAVAFFTSSDFFEQIRKSLMLNNQGFDVHSEILEILLRIQMDGYNSNHITKRDKFGVSRDQLKNAREFPRHTAYNSLHHKNRFRFIRATDVYCH
ncbi:13243_t:CDS:2 [Acaulospora morrowiae]|uniref:13243_t:CDS:1 n=1 Tax=Acaulospora morrowiae TaxID=94023 RepID=A0A9N9FC89_9GLOM|nr:13243_t:CDS:2 [Acaulospora morrowiae]